MALLQKRFCAAASCFVASTMLSLALHAQALSPQAGLVNRNASAYNAVNATLYLVDTSHNAVTLISAGGKVSSIPVGQRPDAVAVNNRTGRVYVVNPGSKNVSVIDGNAGNVIATVATAARPYAIAVDEVENKIYVSNTFSNMLTVIDGATDTASNLKVGSADAVMVDSDRHRIYLLGYESDSLTEINPADGSTAKIPAGAMHLWGLARSGSTLYVSHLQDSSIAAVDLTTHSIHTIATGAMPCAIVEDATRDELYVANYSDGTVTVVHHQQPIAAIPVAARPQSLALDRDKGLLYVASPQQNQVTVIDLRKRLVVRRLHVDEHPYAVAIHPVTHTAFAINLSGTSYTPLKGE
ncbi:MAG: YncE family protein [Edaphobacter sp.]|uniref:YncE family protein n=1 Tax=Edaphobacter sp. TaxID=1934404 RepID=UPI0023A2AF14|nr:YncE family protein [Edaphobacter sp.]MDE1176120.1 YncE family protein [Edaphobacter sp.]